MNTITKFVTENQPKNVTLAAEQIISAAREIGCEVEYPNKVSQEDWLDWMLSRLFGNKKPVKNYNANGRMAIVYMGDPKLSDKDVAFRITLDREGLYYDFGKGSFTVEWNSRLTTGAGSVVEYTPKIRNSSGYCALLDAVLEKLGIPTMVRVATPEPIVAYPKDDRDGAPKEGSRLFLSRARALAQGNEEVENILQDPTGEILWEKEEWCWINGCGGSISGPFTSKEEADAAPLPWGGGCQCGECTDNKTQAYTLVYGEKKYLPA